MGSVDWTKMARPQVDGSDTIELVDLARQQYNYIKKFPEEGIPATFGGCVTLRGPSKHYAPYVITAPLDHRNIEKSAELIRTTWPEMFVQIAELLEWFEPLIDTNYPDDDLMAGCSSGSSCDGFGGINVTVQSPVGCAEGIVHEFGHMKLHAMGVHLLDWTNIIGNDPSELFDSPIRKDITRPMGAVLQAQYSYIHVLHLDIALNQMGLEVPMLELNYKRMKAGQATLREHFRPGLNGAEFMQGLEDWTEELFSAYGEAPR